MASLHANLEKLNDLSYVLETFNESFASYLYALRMNAFCVEWEQAPGDTSFVLAAKAAEEAQAAISSLTLRPPSEAAANQDEESLSAADQTYATDADLPPAKSAQAKPQGILKNAATSGVSKAPAPGKKAALTAKEKKARDAKIDRVINVLPLEFRGNDPDLRKVMEGVIGCLMDNEGGLRIAEIAKPPLLPQVKVNKCLIALVGRKVVEKETTKV
ncbi:hypothetical protein FRC01_007497 [Tulasnella sp. 417]|nr:hypothetical protein FRC01_007497 [Tulasnella sp. 417]